ncbi:hypothetical protein NBRC116602_05190 [Hyphomicrobiales bacterium 4NK60-0047b]
MSLRLCMILLITPVLVTSIWVLDLNAAEKATKATEKKTSKLVEYEIFNLIQSKSIPKPLAGKKGNWKRGEALILDVAKGNCLQCHRIDQFHEKAKKNPDVYGNMGEIGPSLDGVASRYKDSQLRLILVNAKLVFPETIMPAYYRIEGLTRVDDKYLDKPIMSAQDVEDILSFLMKLQ